MAQTKAKSIRDVMTPDPLTLEMSATVADAAKAMKVAEVGPIPIVDPDGTVRGIVTDRDLVVRAIAEGRDPKSTRLGEVLSADITSVAPADSIDAAVKLMRERSIRRLPVIEDGRAVGIVSIGDLAREQDRSSALADISSAPANS
jgi:CBS domain-containing protein